MLLERQINRQKIIYLNKKDGIIFGIPPLHLTIEFRNLIREATYQNAGQLANETEYLDGSVSF